MFSGHYNKVMYEGSHNTYKKSNDKFVEKYFPLLVTYTITCHEFEDETVYR